MTAKTTRADTHATQLGHVDLKRLAERDIDDLTTAIDNKRDHMADLTRNLRQAISQIEGQYLVFWDAFLQKPFEFFDFGLLETLSFA